MKTLLKGSLVVVGLLAYLALSGWIIFSQDAWMGLFVGVLLILVPFFLGIVSITALFIGKIPAFGIQSRIGAFGNLLSASVAGFLIVVLVAANSFVLFDTDREFTAVDKFNWYGQLAGIKGMQQDTYEVEGEHAIYIVTEATENKIEEIEELYPAMEAQLDRFLPAVKTNEKPEIELHESASTLSVMEMGPHTAGVFSKLTGRMHVHVEIADWEEVLIHEYAHYRVHNYQLEETGGMVNTPHWLEEGFAEVVSRYPYLGPVELYKEITLTDAANKILQRENQLAGMNVYPYGHVVTTELLHTVPLEQFQGWLLQNDVTVIEKEIREIYEVPEAVETQLVLIEAYEKVMNSDLAFYQAMETLTTETWQNAWQEYEEQMYFQMYPDYLYSLRMHILSKLDFEAAELLLELREEHDLFMSIAEKQQEQAFIDGGRGDLKSAISQLEESLRLQDVEERDELVELRLELFKMLQENPYHPEALQILEKRSIFWDGTEEWLRMIQESRT